MTAPEVYYGQEVLCKLELISFGKENIWSLTQTWYLRTLLFFFLLIRGIDPICYCDAINGYEIRYGEGCFKLQNVWAAFRDEHLSVVCVLVWSVVLLVMGSVVLIPQFSVCVCKSDCMDILHEYIQHCKVEIWGQGWCPRFSCIEKAIGGCIYSC